MPTDVEHWKSELYGTEIRERLFDLAEEGWDAIPEDEHDAWFERFKWWGLYHQRNGQESYFMMRIGTPNGVLTPGQTEVVAEIAEEYAEGPAENPIFGNGWVDWTTRQSIQLHWIKLEDVPEIFERLESVGLSTQQACGDSWRNIVGCPVAGKDKHEHVDALPVAEGLHDTYKGHDEHSNLPRKWKVAVTGCREGCGQGDINDLAFEPATKEIDGEDVRGFNINVGGGLARNEPRLARELDVFVTPEEAVEVGGAISALFRDYGNREDRYSARMKFLVDEMGVEDMRETLQAEYVDFDLRTAGVRPAATPTTSASTNSATGTTTSVSTSSSGGWPLPIRRNSPGSPTSTAPARSASPSVRTSSSPTSPSRNSTRSSTNRSWRRTNRTPTRSCAARSPAPGPSSAHSPSSRRRTARCATRAG
jgi:ferredoxin-nitrite reductase